MVKKKRKCVYKAVSPLFALAGAALASSMIGTSHRRCACFDEGYAAGKEAERERIKDLLFEEGDDE